MTLLGRTTNQLIEGAFKILSLYTEDRALGNNRMTEGLFYLNALLSNYASSPSKIAYDSELTFDLVPNQRSYTISKAPGADVDSERLVILKFVRLKNNDTFYEVDITKDSLYFNGVGYESYTGLPSKCFLQNSPGFSTLTFFEKPDIAYSCTIKGKFVLAPIELNQSLSIVPNYYYLFLESALARTLASRYKGSTWASNDEAQYQEMLKSLTNISDVNIVADPGALLSGGTGYGTLGDFYSG